jgi:hypothetical protein
MRKWDKVFPKLGNLQSRFGGSTTTPRFISHSFTSAYAIRRRDGIDLALIRCMREFGAGLLMLMVCGAIYLQTDPAIWSTVLKLWSGSPVVRHHEFAFNPAPDVLRPETLDRVPRPQNFPL